MNIQIVSTDYGEDKNKILNGYPALKNLDIFFLDNKLFIHIEKIEDLIKLRKELDNKEIIITDNIGTIDKQTIIEIYDFGENRGVVK